MSVHSVVGVHGVERMSLDVRRIFCRVPLVHCVPCVPSVVRIEGMALDVSGLVPLVSLIHCVALFLIRH